MALIKRSPKKVRDEAMHNNMIEGPSEDPGTPLLQPGPTGDGSEALLPSSNDDYSSSGNTGAADDDAVASSGFSNGAAALRRKAQHAIGAVSFPTRAKKLRAFSRPRQRQRWDDEQVLPHVNWGDLFFDLFYVAGAYNLGDLLKHSLSAVGILYFAGLFGPLMAEWFHRMMFDARYVWGDDPLHRLQQVLHLCFLATAVVHVRSVDVMSAPADHPGMFGYALGVFLLAMGNVTRCVEVRLWVDGEPAARRAMGFEIGTHAAQAALYLAAACIAGGAYYGEGGGGGEGGEGPGEGRALRLPEACSAIADAIRAAAVRAGDRALAEAGLSGASDPTSPEPPLYVTHVPVGLCLAGWFLSVAIPAFRNLFLFPGGGKHKLITVPMNVDFSLHRMGEWIMLLLGESILGLLIVETSTNAHYVVTFYAGIGSVVLLQYLHFKSQPHHADRHAMTHNKNATTAFFVLTNLYSFALVAVGVSYKLLVYDYTYAPRGITGPHLRRLESLIRTLVGGGEESASGEDEHRQRVAHLFCGSTASAWACLDLMALTHQGMGAAVQRARVKFGVLLAAVRVALIVFVATLSQYETDPVVLSLIGLACLIMQVTTRILGDVVYPAATRPTMTHRTREKSELGLM